MPPVSGSVPFLEAIAYLKDRLAISDADWRGILQGARAQADSAVDQQAEAMRKDMLAAAAELFEQGGTAADFETRYVDIAQRYGWSTPSDPGWHSRLIWRMETFGARAAGRWEQAQRMQRYRPGAKLYFRYVTAGDHRVRDTHQQWHGVILPIDHPFWQMHFPPNGFNCRCHVMIISGRDLVRYGWTVTADSDPRLGVPPDPGFEGNVGLAWSQLRGDAATGEIASGPTIEHLVDQAELLAPFTSVDIGQVPGVIADRLGATRRDVALTVETVLKQRPFGSVDARAYGIIAQRLFATGQFVTYPGKPDHLRLIGEVEGAIWAAVIKVDQDGRLWLITLRPSTRQQMWRWLKPLSISRSQ